MRLAGLTARLLPAVFVAGLGSLVLAAGGAPVRLLGVSATAGAKSHAVLIEASEPVAYSVSRPDALTVLVEMRNVRVGGATSAIAGSPLVRSVEFEDAVALDGNPVGRVRVSLAQPAAHKVRSERNTIRVELQEHALRAGRPRVPTAPVAPLSARRRNAPVAGAATVLQSVRVERGPGPIAILLGGNGPLLPGSVTEAEDMPPRVVVDFPGVTSTAPVQTNVGGAVRRVRVGMNRRTPPVTRVVIDLEQRSAYRVERRGRDLAILIGEERAEASSAAAPGAADTPAAPEPPAPAATAAGDGLRDADTGDVIPILSDLTQAAGTGSVDPVAAVRLASAATPATLREPAPPPGAGVTAPAPARMQQPAATPAPARPDAASLTAGQIGPDTQKQYTGHPVSLDFQNADLRSVLRTFAEISGLNMVIDPTVQGSVDIVLTDVPWDQALDIILRANNLGYTVDGTIVRIARIDTLAAEQDQRKKLLQAQAEAGQTVVRTFTLSYARATDVQPLLTRSALSSRGQIQVDARTNTLILTDLPERLDTAANLISILDRAEPQVEVEARVVQTTRDFAHAIGVQWGFGGRLSPEFGNTLPFAFPNRVIVGGRGAEQGPADTRALPTDQAPSNFSAPVTGEGAATIGVQLGAVNGAFNLDLALSALERSGKGRVLSTPRLTTQNNVSAEVAQGIQIPIQTVANNTVTVSFKDAVLLLKVTPQITSANTVIMQITIENASPDFSRSVNNIPPIDTQRAITQVQVNDGATTVIGGIFVSREQSSNNRVPLLHRIPLLGWLFKRDSVTDESRELLIFITPRILRG